MTERRRRKCLNCEQLFRPDPRDLRHQRYCSTPACRKASKAASQARWLAQPHNRTYFRGPEHVARVRAWRRPTRAMRDGARVRYKRTPRRNSLIKLKKQTS